MYIEESLSEQDTKEYEEIAHENRMMYLEGRFSKMFKEPEWTVSPMLKIDFLYTFLKKSIEYRKQYSLIHFPLSCTLL